MENIIGHEKVRAILEKIIKEDKVGHAYLFTGKEGIGKRLVANDFAQKIMNMGESSYNDSDYKLIVPENDLIKIETIRELINEIYLKPVYSKHKVVVINDADRMNINAQNALLKVLEEPPLYATMILITAHKEKIIKTILSRVTEIAFESLSQEELQKIVGEDIDLSYAQGSASKAIALKEESYFAYASELHELMKKKDFLSLNKKFAEVKKLDIEIVKILEMLKIMFYKNIQENTAEKIKNIDLLEDTLKGLNRNANVDLAIDKLMIEICR